MIKKETLIMIVVGALIVLPAASSMMAYAITKNPSLRPLNLTIEAMTAAGLIDGGEIIAVISTGDAAPKTSTPKQQISTFKTAFERYGAEVQVKFRTVPRSRQTTVMFLVGKSKIGPYPMAQAASGVSAAVQAERMLVKQQRALAAREEAERENSKSWFDWLRVFD